jgi:hypothetical protein
VTAPSNALTSICVFCGARLGVRPAYRDLARRTGLTLARRGVVVVYGGGRAGLMGELADAVLAAGGEVIGIIPRQLLDREVGHTGLTRLEVVGTMHERKARMAELAEAFIALPGGLGTLEELFEVWTWSYLGFHDKPLGLLSTAGYYDHLTALLDHAVEEGFVDPRHRARLVLEEEPERLLDRLAELKGRVAAPLPAR